MVLEAYAVLEDGKHVLYSKKRVSAFNFLIIAILVT